MTNRIRIITLVLLSFGIIILVYQSIKRQNPSQTISSPLKTTPYVNPTPNLLSYIPVTIERIEGKTLLVIYKTLSGEPLTLKVTVDDTTKIVGTTLAKPAIQQITEGSQIQEITLNDLKSGLVVLLGTQLDINNNPVKSEFTATEIKLPPVSNVIRGKIQSISASTLVVMAPSPNDPDNFDQSNTNRRPKDVEFKVKITPQTEISKNEGVSQEGKIMYTKNSISDLTKDMIVVVYAGTAIRERTFTAQSIEILLPQDTGVK